MATAARYLPYARQEGGLASAFTGKPRWWTGGLGVVLSIGLALAWRPLAGSVAVGAAIVAGAGVLWLAVRRIGGYTGDVLGAFGMVAETAGLLVAAAKW